MLPPFLPPASPSYFWIGEKAVITHYLESSHRSWLTSDLRPNLDSYPWNKLMTDLVTERILDNPALCIDHAGKGELVILLHGIGGNRANWTEQVGALSAHFHVVAWDARGYGGSDDYDGALDFNDLPMTWSVCSTILKPRQPISAACPWAGVSPRYFIICTRNASKR